MSEHKTIYISIGNSDDKLTQNEWSNYCRDLLDTTFIFVESYHGTWYSRPDQPWQNMCICVEMDSIAEEPLRKALAKLAAIYRQDSIAWAEATTEFIGGGNA